MTKIRALKIIVALCLAFLPIIMQRLLLLFYGHLMEKDSYLSFQITMAVFAILGMTFPEFED